MPALVNLVAASGAPGLRAAFAAAGLDGIRPGQAVALVPLAAGGLHASDLADRLRVSRQAVAQAVAALERHDYIVRGPHPSDARARIIELTPRGRQALRVMRSNALDVGEALARCFGRTPIRRAARDVVGVALGRDRRVLRTRTGLSARPTASRSGRVAPCTRPG